MNLGQEFSTNSILSSTSLKIMNYIDGQFVASSDTAKIEVVSPYSNKKIYSLPKGSLADVDLAVKAAVNAFQDGRWCDLTPSARKDVLIRFANFIEKEAKDLDALDAEEMGKPVSVQFFNASGGAGLVRFYAEAIDKISGDVFNSDKSSFVTQRLVPRGVVAAIIPWNFPSANALLKVAPALAAGNCVIVKPSELSSRTCIRLAQLASEAGLPPGVFNVILGQGDTVGRALGLHMNVDMVTFTGSTTVGKLMLQYGGQSNMKVVMAECGGKSPQIVFSDSVDIEKAADAIADSILTNQGQVCSAGTRLLVEKSVENDLISKVAERFQKIVPGDPLDPQTTFGPMVSAKQSNKVLGYIQSAQSAGANIVLGGERLVHMPGRCFISPTILRNVDPSSKVAQDEIFGPVLSVIPFNDAKQAVRIANDTIYGLSAGIWTANLSTAMSVAKSIRSSVYVVSPSAEIGEGAGYACSAEPAGHSGIGVEGGIAGLETYMRRQLIEFYH